MEIKILNNTLAFECYNKYLAMEDYYCNFGINPEFKDKLLHPELRISEVKVSEPFYQTALRPIIILKRRGLPAGCSSNSSLKRY